MLKMLMVNYIKFNNIRELLLKKDKIISQSMRKQYIIELRKDILFHNLKELDKSYFKFLLQD